MDAEQLYAAADAIRRDVGSRFEAAYNDGIARMRGAVEGALGVDELAADRLVKQLVSSRLVIYHSANEVEQATRPAVRDQPDAPTGPDAEERVLNSTPPPGLATSMGIWGTGQNIVPPLTDAAITGTRRDDYIDRDATTLTELGASNALSDAGYWEVIAIPSGAVPSPTGPAGPDYSVGHTSSDVAG